MVNLVKVCERRLPLGCVEFSQEDDVATNLAIDDGLVEMARDLGRHKTKKAAVTEALEEYVARRKRLKVLEMFGQLDWDPDYDYKAERRRS